MNNGLYRTILLVEDEAIIALSQKVSLNSYNYNVIIANSGENAIETIEQTLDIDLILMNIDLGKGIDGPEAARIILNKRDIPIVFLSSHTEPEVVEKTEKITSYGYVVKNSGITVLDASIKMAFKLFDAHTDINIHKMEIEAAYKEMQSANEELVNTQKNLVRYGRALDASEKKYRDIYINAVEGIFQTTADGKLIGANPSYASTFGFDSPQSILNQVNDIGHQLYANPGDRERLIKLVTENNRVLNYEVEARTCSGEAIWVSINASAIRDESGTIESITGTMTDITGRRQAEEILRERELRFNQLAEQSLTIVWEIDEKGMYTYISLVVEKVLGYKPEELVGRKYFYDLCPEDEREQFKTEVFESFNRHENFSGFVNPMVARDGRVVHVSTNAIPILNGQNVLLGYRGSDTDITDYIHTLDSLKQSELSYRTLIENTGQAIVVVQNGIIRYANPVTSLISGYTSEEIYLRPFIEFIHPDDRDMVSVHYQNRSNDDMGSKSVYMFRVISKHGDIRWAEIKAVKIDWNGDAATLNFLTDFTEQMRVENELRESEAKYRKIFENVQDIFYQIDLNGIIIEISPSIERYSGFSREELIGKSVESVYCNPGERAELLKIISTYGEVIDYELHLTAKDNRILITSASSHILYDSQGNPAGVEGSLRDITERKRVEEALRESEKLHRLLTDNATDVIWTMNLSGYFTYVSPSVKKLRGYTVDEVMMQSLAESLTPESAAIAQLKMASAIEAIKIGQAIPEFRGELEQPCKDGSTVWTEATISAMYNDSGEIIGIVGVSRDISDRKLAEKAVADRAIFQQALIDSIPYPVFTKDAVGRFVGANLAYEKVFGTTRTYMLGKTVLDLEYLPMDERRRFHAEDMSVINEASQRSYEMPIIYADGYTHITLYSVNGFHLADGRPGGLIGMLVDISERKKSEEDIKNLLIEKELILREVHHRIKNNMNTIRSLLSLQADAVEDQAAVNALSDAGNRVQSMMVLYDKLYQSAGSGEISVLDYFSPLIDEIVSNFPNSKSVKIYKKIDNIILKAKVLQPLGIIINELLTNIMKYAFVDRGDGVISVSAVLNDNTVAIEIQDNGVGIPESISFENSTGFGMQLVMMLTEQIGGSIRIERGNGTKFVLEFKI